MATSVNLTKRNRKRQLKSGQVITQTRWVVNYREPRSGKRRQLFFPRQKDAQSKHNEIIASIETGTYTKQARLTVSEIIERWLANRDGLIKPYSLAGYRYFARYIIGPLRSEDRDEAVSRGTRSSKELQLLGHIKVQDLTTSDIRAWHKMLSQEVGAYTANRAKMYLAAALALAAEDLNIRPPAMPTKLGHGRVRIKKVILTSEQIIKLLRAAREDREKGVYVAFPFLAGTRPSEQLGLLWEDIDFERNVIRIRRMQERDGRITDLTKTTAGNREIPMCAALRSMLLEWRVACPRRDGNLHRVFPGPGQQQQWPLPRIGGGGALLYSNFRNRVWLPALRRLGLPSVTPHSARHSFISILQAEGVEIGLVAKIAGHANPAVTLGHYTQAVRGSESAAEALERGYGA